MAVGDVPELGLLREYGEALGLVFQVHDDMLDLLGDANAMGKPTGNSLTQVRPMLPLIYLEQYGTSEQLHLFQRWQQGLIPSPEEVRRCLTESGALAAVERFQQVQIDRAHGVLSQLPSSRGVDGLKQVLAYAVSRSY